jgi:peptide chain release factor 1
MPAARSGGVFDLDLTERGDGLLIFRAAGAGAEDAFREESGGHRWQRIPPNERRGRVHSSTITVAVLAEPTTGELRLHPGELHWAVCRGSGPGGQNRNKTETAVIVTHLPTGVTVRCETERSQHQNREIALSLLRARLWAAEVARRQGARAAQRREQVGSGMRGDKRRTVRCQDGAVTDHLTGRRWSLREYERGEW